MAADLGYIEPSHVLAHLEVQGQSKQTGTEVNATKVGTAAAGVTAVEYGDSRNHITELTLDSSAFVFPAVTGGGATDQEIGRLLYTLPIDSGIVVQGVVSKVGINSPQNAAASIDVGIGSALASAAAATLAGTDEDIHTAATQTASGAATTTVSGLMSADVADRALYLNVAAAGAAWANADSAVSGSGSIIVYWTDLGSNA